MGFRSLRKLFLLFVVVPIGCNFDPHPSGPSAPPREAVKASTPGPPALQPSSLSDYRREKLQKTDTSTTPKTP
jgi:hypothetical protein